ncbi:OLC1v1009738C1 [Oldenlandia corymbosa var. corymbosa]|nr:OLC1v1009738C1 [Oldenlandia corymbosa var. corymbosa]
MLQRQIMFKQLQAMQQRQQLQELNDARQQQYLNQLSVYNKQTSGLQSSSANGMPIQDASQMFMGGNSYSAQRGMTPNVQGFPNGYVFSQAQNQPIYSFGLPQQMDVSLYGNPVNSGEDMNAFGQIQGSSQDYANAFNMGHNSQLEMASIQPSTFSNSFVNERFNLPLDKVGTTTEDFAQRHFGNKNFYGQLPMQSSEEGIQPTNFQQSDSLQKNASSKILAMGQGQAGWPLQSVEKTARLEPSRDTASLDPLEEKILFNSDDSSWESSAGQLSNVMMGFENNRQADFGGSFSANHSGSWSALMQSAVAEASSSDTGQQEEWSGLTFQNPELSTDNDHANYIDDEQQRTWVDNSLQNITSPPSKPEVVRQQSNMNFGFPTFQHDGMHSDFSYESNQQPMPNASEWLDRNSQPKPSVEGCQLVQTSPQLHDVWKDQRHELSRNNHVSVSGNEVKANMWQHENEPQHMVAGSGAPVNLVSHPWSNQEQGYVNNIADIGVQSGKVQSPDTVSSSQVPHVENQNDVLFHESSSSPGMRSMVPPSQQIPRSYFSPSQAQSNVINTSYPWHQSNERQYEQNSVSFNHNAPATFQLATNSHAKVATSPHPRVPFQNTVEDTNNSNKDSASMVVHPQHGQNCFEVGDISREVDVSPKTTQGFDPKVDQVDHPNPCKASSPFSLTRSSHAHGAVACHLSAPNVTNVVSTSFHQQGSEKVEQRDNAHVNVQRSDAFGRYLEPHSLLQKFPLLQQVNANVRQQLLLRLQSGLQNVAQGHTNVNFQLNSNLHAENKPIIPSESGGNLPGKHFSETSIQGSKRLPSVETVNHLPKDQSPFNVQTGPSWFKQYGAMKNGQMLAISNSMHTVPSAQQLSNKSETFQGVVLEDPSNASQLRGISPYLIIKNATAQQSLGNNEQNLAALRPKKRKVPVFDNIPWHKEVTQRIPLHKLSSCVAESEWALASNRLIEKVEDEAEMLEDVLPRSHAKKRLLLTTKLMQQVFQPAPAVILSADASSNSESLVYFVARLALRDACGLTSGSQNPPTSDMSPEELGNSERGDLLDFSKTVENFNDRAKKLENDLLR